MKRGGSRFLKSRKEYLGRVNSSQKLKSLRIRDPNGEFVDKG